MTRGILIILGALLVAGVAIGAAVQFKKNQLPVVADTGIPIEDGKVVHMTVSTGIATSHDDDATVEMLLDRADKALYEAKQTGRDKVCVAGCH